MSTNQGMTEAMGMLSEFISSALVEIFHVSIIETEAWVMGFLTEGYPGRADT